MSLTRKTSFIQFISRTRFRKEITLILILKLLALSLIWGLFFSNPIERNLTKQKLAQHFLVEKL